MEPGEADAAGAMEAGPALAEPEWLEGQDQLLIESDGFTRLNMNGLLHGTVADLLFFLADADCLSYITHFSLGHIGIQGDDAMALALLIEENRFPSLQALDLSGNDIGLEGALKVLATSATGCFWFDLRDNSLNLEDPIFIHGLMRHRQASVLHNISHLYLGGNNIVGDEAREALTAAMDSLEICDVLDAAQA